MDASDLEFLNPAYSHLPRHDWVSMVESDRQAMSGSGWLVVHVYNWVVANERSCIVVCKKANTKKIRDELIDKFREHSCNLFYGDSYIDFDSRSATGTGRFCVKVMFRNSAIKNAYGNTGLKEFFE